MSATPVPRTHPDTDFSQHELELAFHAEEFAHRLTLPLSERWQADPRLERVETGRYSLALGPYDPLRPARLVILHEEQGYNASERIARAQRFQRELQTIVEAAARSPLQARESLIMRGTRAWSYRRAAHLLQQELWGIWRDRRALMVREGDWRFAPQLAHEGLRLYARAWRDRRITWALRFSLSWMPTTRVQSLGRISGQSVTA